MSATNVDAQCLIGSGELSGATRGYRPACVRSLRGQPSATFEGSQAVVPGGTIGNVEVRDNELLRIDFLYAGVKAQD